MQSKELVVDTWSPKSSMKTLKYFLSDATKHKAIFHQLYFIGAFLQEKVKNRVLSSWMVDIQITFPNMKINLEEP